MSDFSRRLAAVIEEKGITQRELARRSGTTEATISRYVNGSRAPKAALAVDIAAALGVTTEYLLNGTQENEFERDPEVLEMMEELHHRPELRALFSTSRNASPEDIRKVISIIEDITKQDRD